MKNDNGLAKVGLGVGIGAVAAWGALQLWPLLIVAGIGALLWQSIPTPPPTTKVGKESDN